MNVLAIIGSPRKKGNTYKVVRQIEDNILQIDNSIKVEYIYLTECDLKMCMGCFNCFAKGRNFCSLTDDFDVIYDKIIKADGVIVAAPTYAMGVPALMKNFIDRLAFSLHRPCFFDQTFLAVSTVGGYMGLSQALSQLSLLSAGAKKSFKIGIPMPPIELPSIQRKAQKKLVKGVKNFYKSMKKDSRHNPRFGDLAYFNAFKVMSNFKSYKSECPADYEYYKDKDNYFYSVKKANVILGKAVNAIMRLSFRMIVKEK